MRDNTIRDGMRFMSLETGELFTARRGLGGFDFPAVSLKPDNGGRPITYPEPHHFYTFIDRYQGKTIGIVLVDEQDRPLNPRDDATLLDSTLTLT